LASIVAEIEIPLTLTELQPYFTAITAGLGVATLGFLLNVVKTVRENAQDRIALQEERLKHASEYQQRTEKWAEREKAELNARLGEAKDQLDALMKSQGLDLGSLALGKQVSDSAADVRTTMQSLVQQLKEHLAQLPTLGQRATNADVELSVAMGAMAAGSFADAATHFDSYARNGGESWQAHFSRGIAHANSRQGASSDLSALRAYNDALALAPNNIDQNRRARLFIYRGAMLKRLGRLAEAEADLQLGLTLADAVHEQADARYNLACVYAMSNQRAALFRELSLLSPREIAAVRSHMHDYFVYFASDAEFLRIVGASADS
jgi:tetratricopeptide (TPR) repeat protein